jgi:hypothetical protein
LSSRRLLGRGTRLSRFLDEAQVAQLYAEICAETDGRGVVEVAVAQVRHLICKPRDYPWIRATNNCSRLADRSPTAKAKFDIF